MDLKEIEKLMKMLEESSLSSLEVEENGLRIKLDKNSTNNTVVENKTVESVKNEETKVESGNSVISPLVGPFHDAPYKGASSFVNVGDTVKKGDKLCIIEAMKVMNEITSPYDGVIKEIYATDNQMVEFDKKLFLIGE